MSHSQAFSDPALSNTDSLTTEESNPEPESLDTLPQQRNAERILTEDMDIAASTAEKVHKDLKYMHENLEVKIKERQSRLRKTRTQSQEPTPPKQHKRKFFKWNCELPVTSEEKEETAVRLSSTFHTAESESDKSGGLPKRLSLETFEIELEKIMESFVIEKVNKTAEIHRRYESQLAELSPDNTLMRQIIDQIRIAETQEIAALVESLETKRKEDIQKLRDLHLK